MKLNIERLNDCPLTKLNAVKLNKTLSADEKLLLTMFILKVDNNSNQCKYTRSQMMEDCKITRGKRDKTIKALISKGIIIETKKGSGLTGASEYQLQPFALLSEFDTVKQAPRGFLAVVKDMFSYITQPTDSEKTYDDLESDDVTDLSNEKYDDSNLESGLDLIDCIIRVISFDQWKKENPAKESQQTKQAVKQEQQRQERQRYMSSWQGAFSGKQHNPNPCSQVAESPF